MKAPGDHRWIIEIEKDINRQFPQHIMFSETGPYGHAGCALLKLNHFLFYSKRHCYMESVFRRSDLLQLLKAYTILHPDEGYCQAQAPVASVLLMHMPLRDAFYCFVQICHKYLPDYYGAGLVSKYLFWVFFEFFKNLKKLSIFNRLLFFTLMLVKSPTYFYLFFIV